MKTLGVILSFYALPAFAGYNGPSALRDVAVHAAVAYEARNHRYTYSYTVDNNNKMYAIDRLGISVARSRTNEEILPVEGLTVPMLGVVTLDQVVPVECTKKSGWMCFYMPDRYVTFCGIQKSRIETKSRSSAFNFVSYGLPAIRSVAVRPHIDIKKLPEDWSDDEDNMSHLTENVSWHGKSIGPAYPPRVVDVRFVDYILGLNEESLALKWIANADRSEDFKTYLNVIKKKMSSKDLKAAHATLKSLMQELIKEQGKSLTSEGFALLYFNAKYLEEHL